MSAIDGRRLGSNRLGKKTWSDMHESVKEVCNKIEVKEAGQRIAGLGELAWRKSDRGLFFSPKEDLQAAFNKRDRESLLEAWNVDIQVQVEASEASYDVLFDRVGDPWPRK